MILSAGAFAQRSYSDAEKQREDFYKEEIPSIIDAPEEDSESETKEQLNVKEDFLGFGLSLLGPEISYSHRKNHFQLDLALASMYLPDRSGDGMLTFWPKLDLGYNFSPESSKSFFLGGFVSVPLIFFFLDDIEFTPFFLFGMDASYMIRLSNKMELAFTSYLPVPLFLGLSNDIFGFFEMLEAVFVAPFATLTVDLRFRL